MSLVVDNDDNDHSSDAHGPPLVDIAVQALKLSEQTKEVHSTGPMIHSTHGPPLPTTEHISDATSVHSMPALLYPAPESPLPPRPSTARAMDSSSLENRIVSPSPSPGPTETSHLRRDQVSRRSTVEARASNRLSGFFTNFIHRRDHPPLTSGTIHEEPLTAPAHTSTTPSRSSSPPPGRPVTPPPELPPPTLQELGLSLSVLTSDLSPSHFTTPPTSGAFLAPHYLLLCHAQGLDVLPLVSPPAPQPYALVRRVNFKSVVVMEQRGVLVAIAGRRDGVRVYALEEVKKAIEWRIEVEVRRERDRIRRDGVKKLGISSLDGGADIRDSADKIRKGSLSTPPPSTPRTNVLRRGSLGPIPTPTSRSSVPTSVAPRIPTIKPPYPPSAPTPLEHFGLPPSYSSAVDAEQNSRLRNNTSVVSSIQGRARGNSVNNVLAAVPVSLRNPDIPGSHTQDSKADWVESSDDEAIDVVAAGSSGSQALDERTSARLTTSTDEIPTRPMPARIQSMPSPRNPLPATRRNRPSNLDLTLSRSNTAVIPPEPSPAPTLLTLRQTLSHSPLTADDPDTPIGGAEEEESDANGRISLVQALLESRIPDLPPPGTRRPQQPIFITSSDPIVSGDDGPSRPQTSDGPSWRSNNDRPERRRRRWSVILGQTFNPVSGRPDDPIPSSSSNVRPSTASSHSERSQRHLSRSHSFRSDRSQTATLRPSSASNNMSLTSVPVPPLPENTASMISAQSSRSSRLFPRLINAFHSRRSDERPLMPLQRTIDLDNAKRFSNSQAAHQLPPPKLEYVKLPGTKGALTIKTVETAKKSFLAILCGENGEKVELFAGTYRTALGLSRTFILPDSPRSLELQLQGDDLVEVFLVFSQNVFGLEPATVRVREVRIGRAERRAARRRAREVRTGEAPTTDAEVPLAEEDMNVDVSIGVSVAVAASTTRGTDRSHTPPLIASEHPEAHGGRPSSPTEALSGSAIAHAEELVALATAHMGPYTTFQQLSFAPKFPLASIADEYIIPPTYPDFLDYRAEHEPEINGNHPTDLSRIQFSPPGLPIPAPSTPSRWFYRDPKSVIHGPWKASLMQAWYKDGLLPPDLPVRREEDNDYVLLKDLRLQSIDPTHPFRSLPSPSPSPTTVTLFQEPSKPLLSPISLLSQPRHFGPPALFFSSRGGHSTAIVDARGRSVLKGRFLWSDDEHDDTPFVARMGDVKRLEAFDVKDRAVLVAMRQGGLEAVDLGDALLKPADESRTVLPQFSPPPSNINRRSPFVWKIGTPVAASATSATILSSKNKGSSHMSGRKQSNGSAKSPAGRMEFSTGDTESEIHDEVLFLGRKDDEIYICERNAGSFRILRLCPDLS